MLFEHLLSDLRSIFKRDSDLDDVLPVMDGPWTPNRALDQAPVLGEYTACDDITVAHDGTIFISSGSRILRFSDLSFAASSVHATFAQPVGALLAHNAHLYAALEDAGVVRLDAAGREISRLESVSGTRLRCVTAMTALPDGRLVLAEGSMHHTNTHWTRDLMEKRASGRIILAAADLSTANVLCDGLAWPAGLLARGDAELWCAESWRHQIVRITLDGARTPIMRNLPGYPGRLSRDAHDGAWLALFAVRTHLVELVLRERAFREEMLATIDPRYWIAPSLQSSGHYLEPLQGGALKKLGAMKPWAPPLSYGLIAHLTADATCIATLHSRAGGRNHGVTAVRELNGRRIALAKGAGCVLECGGAAASLRSA